MTSLDNHSLVSTNDSNKSISQWVADHLALAAASIIINQSTCRNPSDQVAADHQGGMADMVDMAEGGAGHEATVEEWDTDDRCTGAAGSGDGDANEYHGDAKWKGCRTM